MDSHTKKQESNNEDELDSYDEELIKEFGREEFEDDYKDDDEE